MRILISLRSLFVVLAMLAVSGASFGQVSVGISVGFAPPELPVYEQPICPGDGYIWTPGYWGWDADADDYYWVPGTWVLPPQVGFLWTPGWWGWGGSAYIFHQGYWGPVVGFYGGIDYGYGYVGRGYEGGRWEHDHFYYNRSVNNVNVTQIHNVYNTTVVNNYNTPRVSYNGGRGGINERPTAQDEAAARERHVAPVAAQTEHWQAARSNQELRASVNHGKPPIAATSKPAVFSGGGVVPARAGGNYNPPPRAANNERGATGNGNHNSNGNGNHNANANSNANANAGNASARPVHPKDLQPHERPTAPNTGNQKQDQKYQQQQQKLYDQQIKDHQKLQQKQDQQHQKVEKQTQDAARKQQVQQQMEQKHQQQTQQMEQRHTQQQQQMQAHQQPHQQPQQHPAPPPPHENPPSHH